MFKSVSLAATAALNGDGAEEFDTQRCLQLQEEIISSERPAADNDMSFPVVASSNFRYNIDATNNERHVTGHGKHHNQAQEVFHEIRTARDSEINARAYGESPLHPNPVHKYERTRDGLPVFPTVKRDNGKNLRPFDINGNPFPLPCAQLRAMESEEYTQKSNLSLTQENPESLYEALELQRLKDQAVLGTNTQFSSSPPIPFERDDLPGPRSNGISGDPNYTHTESTARTYEENDTGHINFDTFQPASVPDEGYLQSEDPPAIHSTQDPEQETLLDPQTPAPSVNPFSEKGSVMKQHELFGATQPSSIGRLGGSPTSSRPSPDVFNGYRSSQEVEPSPLVRRSEVASATTQQSEQSLDRSTSTETSIPIESAPVSNKIQSFNSALRELTLVREPQDTYIPMKESQERRNNLIAREVSSGSDSDSDIEALPKKFQKAAREKKKLRAQTALSRRRPTPSDRPNSAKEVNSIPVTASTHQRSINHQRKSSEVTSSHTPQVFESTPIAVEVPASGRRRSMQEDYVAQCEGFDARGTQPTQQDMIADSQGVPLSSNLVTSSPVSGPRNRAPACSDVEMAGPESTSSSQRLPRKLQQPLSQDRNQPLESKNVVHADDIQENDPSLPAPSDQNITASPNEVSVSDVVEGPLTQIQNPPLDGVAFTVPETSPATDRLIPMTEIAEISLSIANNEELDDLPGFNMDDEFNEVIGVSSYHTPKRQSQFRPPLATTPHPFEIIPNGSAATASSGLSSAPSTIEPPTPAAKVALTSAFREVSERELSTEPSNSNFSADTSKTALEDVSSPLASSEHDAKLSETAPTEEAQLPPTKREQESVHQRTPRKSTRFSKGQFGKPPITQQEPIVARNTRLSSVSSTVSNPLSYTAESDLVSPSVSNSNSITRGRSRGRPRGSAANKVKGSIGGTDLPATKIHHTRSSVSPEEQEHSIPAPLLNRKSILPSQAESEDPLALSTPPSKPSLDSKKSMDSLFEGMAFAVSYVDADKDKQVAIRLIKQHGGRILDDGFENLEIGEAELEIASSEVNIGFVALIADEHSRKAKYMQALALGLPCISGRWISHCVEKCTIIDWLPYLLSAGNSSFLGGAVKSRYLRPYSASNANLNDTFTQRLKLLDGKSILIVTGKGKASEKRKPYTFLTRALGPTRLGQAQDLKQAREMLLDAESKNASYDWLYVDRKQDVEAAVFENTPASTSGGGRKRKRASIQEEDASSPLPKRIRVVNDEVMIQSLILGQLIED
ncbi:putative dna damage repair protein [Botrytis fragariae]|uniref:Putative dna damage repair protein n=1 Tax=Botrytis fragariae TaxID=1964551 RepID=A0A8H6AYN8_9HELO|nr:putative dna damage repair protein [Botrytis fragariae]KAF5875922.1 putative dna damage repair protein [Botrytis fragariae]